MKTIPETAKHTPTPWKSVGRTVLGKEAMVADCRPRSNYPDHGEAAANAAHIVLCVNSHDRLVAACEWALNDAENGGSIKGDALLKIKAALAALQQPKP